MMIDEKAFFIRHPLADNLSTSGLNRSQADHEKRLFKLSWTELEAEFGGVIKSYNSFTQTILLETRKSWHAPGYINPLS